MQGVGGTCTIETSHLSEISLIEILTQSIFYRKIELVTLKLSNNSYIYNRPDRTNVCIKNVVIIIIIIIITTTFLKKNLQRKCSWRAVFLVNKQVLDPNEPFSLSLKASYYYSPVATYCWPSGELGGGTRVIHHSHPSPSEFSLGWRWEKLLDARDTFPRTDAPCLIWLWLAARIGMECIRHLTFKYYQQPFWCQ